jgi:hypothetical protein
LSEKRAETIRLHSAIGYVTPWDKLCGREQALFAARDQKLEQAREQRKINRQKQFDYSLSQQAVFSI